MRITQKAIAKDLGVSFLTVSRVFNNSGYVSQELRSRILNYAKEKGYKPHRASQILVRNTMRTIAVFSSTQPEYFWNDVKKGVLQAAEQIKFFNYDVHYHMVPAFNTEKYCDLILKEIENGLDALAFVCQNVFDMNKIISIVENANIPYLFYNVDAPNTKRLCYIGANYQSGGKLAANFIGKALGLKRDSKALVVGFTREEFLFPSMPDINSERLEGFLSVIKERFPTVSSMVEYVSMKSWKGKNSFPELPTELTDSEAEQQIMQIFQKYQGKVDAVYFIPAFNDAYHHALEHYDYKGLITLQHDIDNSALDYLENDLLTAVIFQDPVLQGYTVVRTLEGILESKNKFQLKDIEIAHNLVFRDNINFLRNHYLMPEAAEEKL